MWLRQVAVWGALAVSWFTGLYLLLVPAPLSQLASDQARGELPLRDSVMDPTTVPLVPGENRLAEQIANFSGGAAVFALVPLLTLVYIWEEALQLRSDGIGNFLASPASYLDLTLIITVALMSWRLLAVAQDEEVEPEALHSCVQVGALGTFVVLLKGGQLMRGHTRMAFLMTMLYEILFDMVPFLLLQAAVVLTFSFSSVLLHVNDVASADEFGTLGLAVFVSYNLLIHAAGTDNADLYFRTSTIFLLLSSLFTLLVNVVMLNALIAIMSDTYERVSEQRIERGLQQRAELLVEYEKMMLSKSERNGFASWLHAIRRKDDALVASEADQWAGQLRRIKDDVKSLRGSMEAKMAEVKGEVKGEVAKVEAKMDELLGLLRSKGVARTAEAKLVA